MPERPPTKDQSETEPRKIIEVEFKRTRMAREFAETLERALLSEDGAMGPTYAAVQEGRLNGEDGVNELYKALVVAIHKIEATYRKQMDLDSESWRRAIRRI